MKPTIKSITEHKVYTPSFEVSLTSSEAEIGFIESGRYMTIGLNELPELIEVLTYANELTQKGNQTNG